MKGPKAIYSPLFFIPSSKRKMEKIPPMYIETNRVNRVSFQPRKSPMTPNSLISPPPIPSFLKTNNETSPIINKLPAPLIRPSMAFQNCVVKPAKLNKTPKMKPITTNLLGINCCSISIKEIIIRSPVKNV